MVNIMSVGVPSTPLHFSYVTIPSPVYAQFLACILSKSSAWKKISSGAQEQLTLITAFTGKYFVSPLIFMEHFETKVDP